MSANANSSVQDLLARIERGDTDARDQLIEVLYSELHGRARKLMQRQQRQVTLHATVLVHEAYVRMLGDGAGTWKDRTHFLATASTAMRQVLIDYARKRRSRKRTATGREEPLEKIIISFEEKATDLLELNDAIDALRAFNPEMARAVELRFFGGASVEETAGILGLSVRTFTRRWAAARAWLYSELS